MAAETANNQTGRLIRRQALAPATRRYARSLPQYQPANDIPQYMLDMLRMIEDAETAKN